MIFSLSIRFSLVTRAREREKQTGHVYIYRRRKREEKNISLLLIHMSNRVLREEEQQQLKQLEMEIQFHEIIGEIPSQSLLPMSDPQMPKKRGPKKKQMTPSRVARFKVRRIKANGRERERMKGLNEQLELLRETIPCFSLSQKLSKIETLRLAKNYIEALGQMIATNQILDNTQFAQLLCKDLSPNTMNLVAATLSLNPRVLQTNNDQSIMNFDETYMLSSRHPRVNNPLEFINLKNMNTTLLTSESDDHSLSYGGDSSVDEISSITFPDYSSPFYSNSEQQQQAFVHSDHELYYYPSHY